MARDIVERLRDVADERRTPMDRASCYETEAADEIEGLRSKLDSLQEAYDSAANHADRGWEYLKDAVAVLYKIASPREGREVTGSFDEPAAAELARRALYELPSAGAYEGDLPWEKPK